MLDPRCHDMAALIPFGRRHTLQNGVIRFRAAAAKDDRRGRRSN
jgi:hypothetical protein